MKWTSQCCIPVLMELTMSVMAQSAARAVAPGVQPAPRSQLSVRNGGLGNAASGFVINRVLDQDSPVIPSTAVHSQVCKT